MPPTRHGPRETPTWGATWGSPCPASPCGNSWERLRAGRRFLLLRATVLWWFLWSSEKSQLWTPREQAVGAAEVASRPPERGREEQDAIRCRRRLKDQAA